MALDPSIVNANFVKIAPELASKYAQYPLNNSRWMFPQETLSGGQPGFIPASQPSGLKVNYVFGRTTELGSGYYHLLTRTSYQLLFNRIQSEAPASGCCSCDKAARKQRDEYERVKRIIYYRSVASVPNDEVAATEAIRGAQNVAQGWHNALQNEQLLVGGVLLATQ